MQQVIVDLILDKRKDVNRKIGEIYMKSKDYIMMQCQY